MMRKDSLTMETNSNSQKEHSTAILLDLPVQDDRLFRSQAMSDLLSFLSRNPEGQFSHVELGRVLDYSRPTISKAVDVLSANQLVTVEREAQKKLVQINTGRLSVPHDPFFQIPQPKFRPPVRAAVSSLREQLDEMIGVVVYGSVARGEADRRSDIDLWVAVRTDRMGNQRSANRVRQDLEETVFDAERFEFEIDVESFQAVPSHISDIRRILSGGIVVHDTDEFSELRKMIFKGTSDE